MESRLVKLLQSTIRDLDDVWREIGYSAKERTEQTELLFSDVTLLFKNKIEQEKVLLESYQDSVEDMREKIALCYDRLDIAPPSTSSAQQLQNEEEPLVLRLSKLKQEHAGLDKKRLEMEEKIGAKLDELVRYGAEMKEPVEISLDKIKLTQDNLNAISHQCGLAKHEYEKRREILNLGRAAVFDLLDCLQIEITNGNWIDQSVANHAELDLSRETLDALTRRAEELELQKQAQSQIFLQLFAEIRPLWEKLGVTQLEQDAFFARQGNTLGDRAMQACRVEVQRLRQLFKSKLKEFIMDIRVEIRAKLDELCPLAPEARRRIDSLLAQNVDVENNFTQAESLLRAHETELREIDKELEELRPIRMGVLKYIALCEERTQYEALIQNSSRLLSRSKKNSGLPSLQEEERMRLRVAQIPKFVQNLKQLIYDYEIKSGQQQQQQGLKIGVKELGYSAGAEISTSAALDMCEAEHEEKLQRERAQRKQNQNNIGNLNVKDARKTGGSTGAPLRPKN